MGSGTLLPKSMGSQEPMEPMLTEPLILISFIKEIEFSLILMVFLLYLMQVRTCIVIGEVSYFATLSR